MKIQRISLEETRDLLKEAMSKINADTSASVEKERKLAENRLRSIKFRLARDSEPEVVFCFVLFQLVLIEAFWNLREVFHSLQWILT